MTDLEKVEKTLNLMNPVNLVELIETSKTSEPGGNRKPYQTCEHFALRLVELFESLVPANLLIITCSTLVQ